MPLVLILFLGVYTPWVALNSLADEDRMVAAHPYYCWQPANSSMYYNNPRLHWDVPGWRWAIPYPFRKGKARIDFIEGDKDTCTGETFNGRWWYVPEAKR